MILHCPNCKEPLVKVNKSFTCNQGHNHDIAKEGYVNLLLPNQKSKLNPGDNALMMKSRELFLSRGYYNFLIEYLESYLLGKIEKENQSSFTLLDLGCGGGYYLRHILQGHTNIVKFGLDISKSGVTKAAKKDKTANYVVGSAHQLPFLNDSLDFVLNIFSPVNVSEMKRVLKRDGFFVKVVPGENHMLEVASLIYETVTAHQSSIENELKETTFEIIERKQLSRNETLDTDALQELISMTPYFYKFTNEQLENLQPMRISFSFEIIVAQIKDDSSITTTQ